VEGFRAEIRVDKRRKASLHLRAVKNQILKFELFQTTNSKILKKTDSSSKSLYGKVQIVGKPILICIAFLTRKKMTPN
jgi:hypothetical protein